MRYVNFERNPDQAPSLDKYNGLIILGGHMGVYEADKYKHLITEMKLIEEALKNDIPILGICLGSQLLAHVLGANVRKNKEKEIGWNQIKLTTAGLQDPLFSHFQPIEKIFQLHGDTFDVPSSAVHLASSDVCQGQAFRYGDKVYGMQFHLEVDQAMILRWLMDQVNLQDIADSNGKFSVSEIKNQTELYIKNSMMLSFQTFSQFIELFALKERPIILGSDHARPAKKPFCPW
jgi:GMP synthase (glutamine-hydrolysing)